MVMAVLAELMETSPETVGQVVADLEETAVQALPLATMAVAEEVEFLPGAMRFMVVAAAEEVLVSALKAQQVRGVLEAPVDQVTQTLPVLHRHQHSTLHLPDLPVVPALPTYPQVAARGAGALLICPLGG